jgi:hypothetical protein
MSACTRRRQTSLWMIFGTFALGDVDQVKANKIVDDLMDTSSVIYGLEERNDDFVSRAIRATRHVPVDAP